LAGCPIYKKDLGLILQSSKKYIMMNDE